MLSEKSKCFAIVLLSLCLIIFPAYLNFSILGDSEITPSNPVLEEIDQDDPILSSEKGKKIFNLTFFIQHILIVQSFLVWVLSILDQPPTLNSKSLILRC